MLSRPAHSPRRNRRDRGDEQVDPTRLIGTLPLIRGGKTIFEYGKNSQSKFFKGVSHEIEKRSDRSRRNIVVAFKS